MSKNYLIIDKKQRIEIEGEYSYALTRLKEEIIKAGNRCDIAYYEDILFNSVNNSYTIFNNKTLSDYSHLILRGHCNQEQYKLKKNLIKFIRDHKIPITILNEKAYDKFETYSKPEQLFIFMNNSVAIPKTWYKPEEISQFPIVAKHIFGENQMIDGKIKKNIYLINSKEELDQFDQKEMYFFQEFIPTGKDIRVYMKKNNFLAAWSRTATENFITVNKGIYTLLEEQSASIIVVSKKVAEILESDFIAIDLMEKDGQPVVLEVNLNPGFKAFETKVTGHNINIAKEILESF